MALRYKKTADRPALKLWLLDDDQSLIDLSTYTFSLKIGIVGSAALLTKTTNITGAAGSGVEPSGTPNCTITWSAGELAAIAVQAGGSSLYDFELTATLSGLDRVFSDKIEIVDTIS